MDKNKIIMYDIAGGAMWGNKVDQIISYYRPRFHEDKNSMEVQVYIQKVKRTGGKLGKLKHHIITLINNIKIKFMNKQEALQRLSALENEAKKLRKIIEAPEQSKKPPEELFWEMINSLTIKIDPKKHPDSVFGFKNEKCVLAYNIENKYIWFHYDDIWKVFEVEYGLNYNEIQSFIKKQIEDYFKCDGIAPRTIR